MTTKIYKTRLDFLKRENKEENGVSAEFAELHPNFEADNETNKGCWNCSYCSYCSDCSKCSDCSYCSDCSKCSDCSYCSDCSKCWNCSDCSDCWNCSDCSKCSDCSDCSDCSAKNEDGGGFVVPIIENVHSKILEAVKGGECLDMSDWHCGTSHCRAGWVVELAGEDGKKLEDQTTTLFAASQILKKSSKIRVAPSRFYESNEVAMIDIQKCAELEKNSTNE